MRVVTPFAFRVGCVAAVVFLLYAISTTVVSMILVRDIKRHNTDHPDHRVESQLVDYVQAGNIVHASVAGLIVLAIAAAIPPCVRFFRLRSATDAQINATGLHAKTN